MYHTGKFKKRSKIPTERLMENGHNKNEVQQQFMNKNTIERTQLVNRENHTISNRTPTIFAYNPTLKR